MNAPVNTIDFTTDRQLLLAARELALSRDLEAIMTIAKTTARELTGADGVTFVLRDGHSCHYADEDAIAPLWKGKRFPLDACISGWVMRRGEPVAIADVFDDPRVPHDAYRPTFVKSLAMVPVRTPDPVAAIGAYWAEIHHATSAELYALQTLADSAALALSNVLLYQELRRAVEHQRIAREAAEAAVTAKDSFLAVVAHELRQPLAAATTSMSVLRSNPSAAIRARMQTLIDRQLVRMTRLVEDLLDASRIIRGEIDLRMREYDVREILDVAVESVRPFMDARKHHLITRLPTTAVTIEADAARLEQVFVNLLQNAARYTPEGGDISVSLTATGDRVRVSVKDTGEGIERDRLSDIFGLFTRASTGGESGFGIGLAVARNLVTGHGGSIAAHSAGPGQGSTFTVELPRRQEHRQLVERVPLTKLG